MKRAADDVAIFDLEAADARPLDSYQAGAHVDVQVPPGLMRQYSLCGDPSKRDHYTIAVKQEPTSRGGSQWMHE
ncbi:MAG: oxidoreductase, partial [Methylobacteriaceae bacterium]|nr:oxidoreductase [Methylobacteriaceae bacterium]